MSRIFISHSSKDNFAAQAIADWMAGEGWDDAFLDIDPERGILPGEKWARRLHEAAHRCQAVIFLISRDWLASEWCDREFNLAVKLNKRLFGVLIDDTGIDSVPQKYRGAWQLLDLRQGTDHEVFRVSLKDGSEDHVTFSAARLGELREGLRQAGLDPEFFEWPPAGDGDRAPYRGLAPLEKADAGIFFGREAPLVDALDRLRGLREAAPPRILAILGASGAGKSSFLRAGLLPRLERDDRAFRVLPIVRPQGAPISGEAGLVTALATVLPGVSRATVRSEIEAGSVSLVTRLASLAPANGPTLVLPIDQAEELFGADAGPEAQPFLVLLRQLAETPSLPLLVLLTIRTDRYMQWQNDPALNALHHDTLPLAPMPRGAYRTIIEAPVARYVAAGHELALDPRLTEAVLAELEQGQSPDALPLLAFTLEQLFTDYRGDGKLTLDDYQRFGGLEGAISAAVTRALAEARGDRTGSPPPPEQLALLKRGLIPWLAGIDPATNTARRKTALWTDIPAEAQPLMTRLIDARLLRSDRNDRGEQIVEPAHEALLRQWAVLDGWLKDDLAALSTLDGVKDAALAWTANNRDAGFIVHAGSRLAAAEGLNQRKDLAENLTGEEREYLAACRTAEDERNNLELEKARKLATAERRVAQRTRLGLVIASILLVVAAGAAVLAYRQAEDLARGNLIVSQRNAVLQAENALRLASEGSTREAMTLLIDGAKVFDESTVPDAFLIPALGAIARSGDWVHWQGEGPLQTFDEPLARYFVDPSNGIVFRLQDELSPRAIAPADSTRRSIIDLAEIRGGTTLLLVDGSFRIHTLDIATGQVDLVYEFKIPDAVREAIMNLEVTTTNDGLVTVSKYVGEALGGISQTWIALYDSATGAEGVASVELTESPLVSSGVTANDRYIFDADFDQVYAISQADGAIDLSRTTLSEEQLTQVKFHHCLDGRTAPSDTFAELIAPHFGSREPHDVVPGLTICRLAGWSIMVSSVDETTRQRTFLMVTPEGEEIDLAGRLDTITSAFAPLNAPSLGPSYMAIDPDNGYVAALVGREVYVFDPGYSDVEGGILVAQFKYPYFAEAAQFVQPGKLAISDPSNGRVVTRDVTGISEADELREMTIVDNSPGAEPLHFGTCTAAGLYANSGSIERDGVRYSVVTKNPTSMTTYGVQIEGPGISKIVEIARFKGCFSISPDFKLLAIASIAATYIVEWPRLVEAGSLDGTVNTTELPAARAAFFTGADNSLVTHVGGNTVQRWTRSSTDEWTAEEIYRGDYPVGQAEPDSSGNLLLSEMVSDGASQMSLYSLAAGRTWFTMEASVNFEGYPSISNTVDGTVLYDGGSEGATLTRRRPTLATLVERAAAIRSQTCPSISAC